MATILVTGGSGFIGSHAILQALAAGFDVRSSVRNLRRIIGKRLCGRRMGFSSPADCCTCSEQQC